MSKKGNLALFALVVLLGGCSPKIGSDAWCNAMAEKPKGDWTAKEGAEYAKSCIFRSKG